MEENRTVQAGVSQRRVAQVSHPPGDGARRPGRLEHGLPDPERRASVFVHGVQPLQLDARATVPLVRHAEAARRGGREGRADRPGRAGRRPARHRRRREARYYNLYANQQTAEILADTRTILEDFRTIAGRTPEGRRHRAGRDQGRGADQRAGSGAGEIPAGDRHGPRGHGPAAPCQPRGRPANALPGHACRRAGGHRAALPTGHRRPPRAPRPAWSRSPATRRPSSSPASGPFPTSRSASPTWT